jgi:hypothetical protein
VRITHPFHPARGQEFVLVEERRSRHGDRVWYEAEDGRVRSIRRDWTSLTVPDPFEVIAAGRARFRPEDLVGLVALLDELQGESLEGM